MKDIIVSDEKVAEVINTINELFNDSYIILSDLLDDSTDTERALQLLGVNDFIDIFSNLLVEKFNIPEEEPEKLSENEQRFLN